MKIRNSFVSNSSSSSFIIGLGIVKDEQKLREFLKDFEDYDDGSWTIGTIKELLNNQDNNYYGSNLINNNNDNISIEAHVNSSPSVSLNKNKIGDKKVFAYRVGNDEGDYYFLNALDEYDYEYDLDYEQAEDPDYFNGNQRKALDLFIEKNDMIEDTTYLIGAERNG